jgi:hypothetical protein
MDHALNVEGWIREKYNYNYLGTYIRFCASGPGQKKLIFFDALPRHFPLYSSS